MVRSMENASGDGLCEKETDKNDADGSGCHFLPINAASGGRFRVPSEMYDVSADFLLGLSRDDPKFTKKRRQEMLEKSLEILHAFEDFLIDRDKKSIKKAAVQTIMPERRPAFN